MAVPNQQTFPVMATKFVEIKTINQPGNAALFRAIFDDPLQFSTRIPWLLRFRESRGKAGSTGSLLISLSVPLLVIPATQLVREVLWDFFKQKRQKSFWVRCTSDVVKLKSLRRWQNPERDTVVHIPVFRTSLDVKGWISRLNIAAMSNMDKLPFLRFVIENNIPFTTELSLKFFPQLCASHGGTYQEAKKLIEPLDGVELQEFFVSVMKLHPFTMPLNQAAIRMLAVQCRQKVPLSFFIQLFRRHIGTSEVFHLLYLVGANNLEEIYLAEYIKAAIETNTSLNALEAVLFKENFTNPDIVQQVLLQKSKLNPEIGVLYDKFCRQYKLVEDLIGFYVGKGMSSDHTAAIKRLIRECDASKALRVVKALLEHTVSDAVFDYLLTSVRPSAFTAELLNLFRDKNRLNLGLKCLEELVAIVRPKLDVDVSLAQLLLNVYQEDLETYGKRMTDFFLQMGKPRCVEIGRMFEETAYRTALIVYQSGECDLPYVELALKNSLFIPVAVYLLTRANTGLLVEVMAKFSQSAVGTFTLDKIYDSLEFRAALLKSTFPAVRTLVKGLMEGQCLEAAFRIVTFLDDVPYQNKHERGFIQEMALDILAISYPQNQAKIADFLNRHNDFDQLRVLMNFLRRKIISPAKIIISRLVQSGMAQEVTDKEITELTDLAKTYNEKNLWLIIGNLQLERRNLKEVLVAYTHGCHCTNYPEVWKAVKTAANFNHWDSAVDYLQMVERTVKDVKVSAALTIALARANRFDELEKLLENSTGAITDEQNCRICEDAPKEVSFLPCRHVCACFGCSTNLTICPICREPITGKDRVYLS